MVRQRAPRLDRLFARYLYDNVPATRVLGSKFARVDKYPIRWHAVRTHSDAVAEWAPFTPDGGRILRVGAAVAARHDEIAAVKATLETEYGTGAVPAAAFKVGRAVVAAEIPDTAVDTPDFPGHAAILLRIGGAVFATVGVLHPRAEEFRSAAEVMSTDPVPIPELTRAYPHTVMMAQAVIYEQ